MLHSQQQIVLLLIVVALAPLPASESSQLALNLESGFHAQGSSSPAHQVFPLVRQQLRNTACHTPGSSDFTNFACSLDGQETICPQAVASSFRLRLLIAVHRLHLRGGSDAEMSEAVLGSSDKDGDIPQEYSFFDDLRRTMTSAEQMEKVEDDSAPDEGEGEEDDKDELAGRDELWKAVSEYYEQGDEEIQQEVKALVNQISQKFNEPKPTKEQQARKDFWRASREGNFDQVKQLYTQYKTKIPNLIDTRDCMDECNITAMMHAAAEGHLQIVTWLLKKGADPRARDHNNISAMHLAAHEGHAEMCVLLYKHAPEMLHWRDDRNATPLIRSISTGQAYTSRTLVSMGAQVESWGTECEVRTKCNGMKWPILGGSPWGKYHHICPMCLWGYMLPEDDWSQDASSPLAFQALLPPEFYPNPWLVPDPPYPYSPSRAGPCWTPKDAAPYNGTGVAQRWPIQEEGKVQLTEFKPDIPRRQVGQKRTSFTPAT